MKISLKNIIKATSENKDYKRLLDNFLSLSGLQIASYILPLITLPYLVRVLGPEKYGLIAFATAFVTYFQMLTDYGFNLSATREISIHRKDIQKISEIFSSVITIKFFLMGLSFIILTIIVFSFEQFKNDWLIYYLTFGIVIGNMLFPTWFYQGMEKMRYVAVLNILAKVIFTVAIFIFIREAADYLFVPLINSVGFIVAGILGLYMVSRDFNLELHLPSFSNIRYQLKEGWHVFISSISVTLYTTSNTFILGLLTNNVIVGYYSVAEKIITAVIGLLTPVSQSIYPYISRVVNQSKEEGIEFIRKITIIIGFLGFILSILVFIFAELIIDILAGNQYNASIIVLQILAFLPLVIGLSNIFGVQTMLTFNYKRAFFNILIIAGILNICLALLLVPPYQEVGTASSFLIAEIFVTISMFLYLNKKGIKIIGFKNV